MEPQAKIPVYYTNHMDVAMSIFGMSLRVAVKRQDESLDYICELHMSPQHAKILNGLMSSNIQAYDRHYRNPAEEGEAVTTSRRDDRVAEVRSTDEADARILVELDEHDKLLAQLALERLRRPMATTPDEEVWKGLDA